MKRHVPATLPMFPEARVSAAQSSRPTGQMSPYELVLHIYWSASVEAQALGAAQTAAKQPSERRALHALQQLELNRKEEARRLLEEIWGIWITTGEHTRRSA